MPEKHRHYFARRQNGIDVFPMAVPRAVRAGYGRNEVCFSLKTTDRKTAQIQVARYVEQYLVECSQKPTRAHTAARRAFCRQQCRRTSRHGYDRIVGGCGVTAVEKPDESAVRRDRVVHGKGLTEPLSAGFTARHEIQKRRSRRVTLLPSASSIPRPPESRAWPSYTVARGPRLSVPTVSRRCAGHGIGDKVSGIAAVKRTVEAVQTAADDDAVAAGLGRAAAAQRSGETDPSPEPDFRPPQPPCPFLPYTKSCASSAKNGRCCRQIRRPAGHCHENQQKDKPFRQKNNLRYTVKRT